MVSWDTINGEGDDDDDEEEEVKVSSVNRSRRNVHENEHFKI